MEIILYIISAIICHFIVETFIQNPKTREQKYVLEDKKTLGQYSFTYAFFTGIVSIVIMCGIGIVYTDPELFFGASLSGFVYYFFSYMMSIRLTLFAKKKAEHVEKIYVQWFINLLFILFFLVILNYITQI